MKRSSSNSSLYLFLFGLGCCTQVYLYGCIAISELVAFVVAPLIYIKNYADLRYLGFTKLINMVFLLMVSLLVSSFYNHTAYPFIAKSSAAVYSIFAYSVVYYKLLRHNLDGIRWLFIGIFLSSVITIFAFNPTAQVSAEGAAYVGDAVMEDVVSGQLFWTSKLKDLMQIPVCGFYLKFPLLISLLSPLVFTGVALATTVSGRAASVAFLVSGAMMIIGRKRIVSMRSIGKYFFSYLLLGIVLLAAVKQLYVYAAKNGYLSDDAQAKYERQAAQGDGFLTILMHGRTGFFAAIPAALNRPIMGYGPFAKDEGGYAERFVLKYGSEDDIKAFRLSELNAMKMGYARSIPTHSYVMGAWVNYGVGGLIFYVWVLFLIYRQIKRYMAAIPQWYGYFAMMLPYYLWNIFFSPFGFRWRFGLLMTCLFFAKAVGDGLMPLPNNMLLEINKHEQR